ncbi:MAG: prephenate dehydrogenase/arogenate dehydrogenase family protein [Pirellulaceae bacterium]|nr:prephenate dehydrogenase/arogenate dehydrogenase family protein [Pirellulaceae bacterium]
MNRNQTIAIVGVGLIGGSIGLAAQECGLAARVIGIGRRRTSLQRAKRCGTVTETTTNLRKGVSQADFVVICTPIDQIVEFVREVLKYAPESTVVTDAGSTKGPIVMRLSDAKQFVGSHPLAGSEKTGAHHARSDLFHNRSVIVTPSRGALQPHISRVEQFWSRLGAQTFRMTAARHDKILAQTSHMPHLLASALAAATPSQSLAFTATGWQDTTRIAGGDVELWVQILKDNRRHILNSMDNFGKVLASFRQALEKGDQAALRRLLKTGKDNRDAVGN